MFRRLTSVCLFAAASLLFTQPAQAGSAAEDVVFGDHPEYQNCVKTEDCVAVKTLCEDWRAVNKRHERKLADAVSFLSVAFVCKAYAPHRSQPEVACSLDRQCQLGK